jgi:integrase
LATAVYIVKRYLQRKRRNGQHQHKLALRWKDPTTRKWRCETTGTADMTEAREIQRLKWAEINGLIPPQEAAEPEPNPANPSWQQCNDALKRAMKADNLRSSYVSDALGLLNALKNVFPEIVSPADITPELANEYKRRRAEGDSKRGIDPVSPWTLRGDLSTLKAVFGKWLGSECGLLLMNPFETIKPPKCDDPEVRIVMAEEIADFFAWFNKRWNNWQLPLIYLEVAELVGWRATEIASLREENVLDDGFVRVPAKSSKSRKHKYGWLPADLHAKLRACAAGGWAFGQFADDLRQLLSVWKHRPNHAAKVKEFSPVRMVGWLQDELQRYNDDKAAEARTSDRQQPWAAFTLHDFRRTAITGMQMAGVPEKEASVMVGATPEVIRRHYEKMDQQAIARRNVERRLAAGGSGSLLNSAPNLCAPVAREGQIDP